MAQSRQALVFSNCAVIVAHPDDETLWAGGTMLMHSEAKWQVITLCRGSDRERSEKFFRALEMLGASGAMGDMDDGPDQPPLRDRDVQKTILSLIAPVRFDLIITHGLWGEYTRHLRHEETSRAVLALRKTEELSVGRIWTFAYEDGGGTYLPRCARDADIRIRLPEDIWQKKYSIITEVYGFAPDTFEARTTPREEAFWNFGADDGARRIP